MNALTPEDRALIEGWGKPARRIWGDMSSHSRAQHDRIALGYVMQKIGRGYTIEHVISTGEGRSSYFMHIGVGMGALHAGKRLRSDQMEVSILNAGSKVYSLRALWREALAVRAARKQKTLFRI